MLAGVQLLLFVAVVPLLRRARRHAGARRPGRHAGCGGAVELLLVAAALAIPAALVADAVPWWRSGAPGLVFAAVTVLVLALATAGGAARAASFRPHARAARRGGRRRRRWWSASTCSPARGCSSTASPATRPWRAPGTPGVGTVGLGVFVAGVLLGAGLLAQRVPRSVAAGRDGGASAALGVLLVGSPYLGADPVGAVALTAGVCIAAAHQHRRLAHR